MPMKKGAFEFLFFPYSPKKKSPTKGLERDAKLASSVLLHYFYIE